MTAHILFLVFFLHGGGVVTQGISAPSYEDCRTTIPLIIIQHPAGSPIKVAGVSMKIDKVVPDCFDVPE